MPESPLLLALIFLGCAAVIVIAGVYLARYGDAIAVRTGLGGLWIGSILLAGATSLPELATDIAAVRIGAPDLAAGDLFGSSMSNMLILALIDLSYPRAHVLRSASLDHVISAMLAILLTAIAALFLLVRTSANLFGIGPGSALLVGVYLAGTRAMYLNNVSAKAEPANAMGPEEEPLSTSLTLRQAIARFAVASVVILAVAPFFARSAEGIAEATGLGTTVVGTWLVGFSTSLPELVASLAAVRLRAFDMAIGNLFGSNAMNMIMFAILDAISPAGPILATVSPVHAMSALVAIMLMSVGMAAIAYRTHGRLRMLEPSSSVMLLLYLMGIGVLIVRGTGG
jgi:cation:H+ antiporter